MKNDIHFEESLFEESSFEKIETALPLRSFWLVAILAIFLFFIILGRILFLNILKGDFYTARASINVNQEIIVPANRGLILDRFGKPLVKNHPTFSV